MVLKAWVIHGESIKMFVLIPVKEQHSFRLDELAGGGKCKQATDKFSCSIYLSLGCYQKVPHKYTVCPPASHNLNKRIS